MQRFISWLCLLLLAPSVVGHPLPNLRHDRVVSVRLSATAVTVRYSLEVNPFTMFLDGRMLFSPKEIDTISSERAFALAYARKMGPHIAEKFSASLEDHPLEFQLVKQELDLSDHIRCRYEFKAAWVLPVGRAVTFAFEDNNFADQPGIMNLTVETAGLDPTLEILDLEEPPPGLRNRPSIDLKPGEADLLRRAWVTVRLRSAPVARDGSVTLAPPPRLVADPGESPSARHSELPVNETELEIVVSEANRPSLVSRLWDRGLVALFDTSYGVGVLLLAALAFGAAHAFTPGHGKTLVAAYLVGERGTIWHAVLLAVTTTIAHTGSVIIIAAVLWRVYGNTVPGTAQGVLQFAGGLLVASVGLWLLMRRIAGKADHIHLFGGHHHHHHHDHDHEHDHTHPHLHGDHHHSHSNAHHHHHHHHHPHDTALADIRSTASWLRLVLMGLGGGLIPCWDAVLLLIAAISLNQLAFALPLLFAFSLGLGAVLVLLGMGVVYAHRAGAVTFRESRWFRWLPTASALLLVGIGLWLCQEGLKLALR